MAIVKIPGTTFVRDTNTMALINTDSMGLEEYNFKTKLINNQKAEINNIKSEINDVKNDVKEIKELLYQLSTRN
jgi:hypothetical protein